MGNCSSTSKCNPCGPNYDAINLLATKTASYARQANTSAVNAANSATDAENYWKEFNALYLGSFASAPTVDNEGNPLQEGALYFNSVSNQMFVWQGASWIDFDFDEFTPFTATGTTTARNLVTRFSEMPSIFDFGAVGNGVADDLPAFTAANNSGKLIFIPKPPVAYNVSAPIKMDKCAVLIDPNNTNWAALTDNGNINFRRGRENGLTTPVQEDCNFWRFSDRILVGGVANDWTGIPNSNIGNAWICDTVNYPGYLGVAGKVVISTSPYQKQSVYGDNPFSLVAGARTSDSLSLAIPLASCIVNDSPNRNAWGQIIEMQHTGLGTSKSTGIEIAIKNGTGIDSIMNPCTAIPANGMAGILLAGGGDNAFGPINNAPVQVGIVFSTSHNGRFNTGICFRNGSLSIGNDYEAIALTRNHTLRWYEDTGARSGQVLCTNNTPNSLTTIEIASSTIGFTNNGGFPFFTSVTTPTSQSRIQINSGSATEVILSSVGVAGTDVDLALSPQNGAGSGRVKFGTRIANADAPITGYIEIKDGAGNLRKLALIS